ncbi:MAG: hypothetical protein ABR567_04490 [Myxococcales bacterium]|nr:hypothetical protein [Myxococcales bacterium]
MASPTASLLALALLASAARAEDTAAPVIQHTPVKYTQRGDKFIQVFAKITDESKFFPQVFYRYGLGEYQKPIDMKAVKGQKDTWGANIQIKGDVAEYYIEAYDELGNGPGRSADPDKPWRVDTSGQGGLVAEVAPPPVVKPPPAPAPKVAPAPVPMAPRPQPVAQASRGRTWTWIVGGAGLGLVAGGLIAGNEMKSADNVYQTQLLKQPDANYTALKAQYDANKSLGQKATILAIAGGALVAASVVLFFVEGSGTSNGSGGDVGTWHF